MKLAIKLSYILQEIVAEFLDKSSLSPTHLFNEGCFSNDLMVE